MSEFLAVMSSKVPKRFRVLSGSCLKLIAIITMTIDHIGMSLFPQIRAMRAIGRIAFPIFCFLIVEGYLHTRSYSKYLTRLLIFAVISEIPFDLGLYHQLIYLEHQNVFPTLAAGLIVIYFLDHRGTDPVSITILAACCLLSYFVVFDYRAGGVLLIAIMYLMHDRPFISLALCSIILLTMYSSIEAFGIIGLALTLLYNGKRGFIRLKLSFYAYYPVHLLVLAQAFAYMYPNYVYK